MTDFTPNETDNGYEWDINPAGGVREVELEYEYAAGYSGGTVTDYLFLTRDDLLAMLAAIDGDG